MSGRRDRRDRRAEVVDAVEEDLAFLSRFRRPDLNGRKGMPELAELELVDGLADPALTGRGAPAPSTPSVPAAAGRRKDRRTEERKSTVDAAGEDALWAVDDAPPETIDPPAPATESKPVGQVLGAH